MLLTYDFRTLFCVRTPSPSLSTAFAVKVNSLDTNPLYDLQLPQMHCINYIKENKEHREKKKGIFKNILLYFLLYFYPSLKST